MKALIFDPFSGATGVMIVGSLLDLVADTGKILSMTDFGIGGGLSVESLQAGGLRFLGVSADMQRAYQVRSFSGLAETVKQVLPSGKAKEDALGVLALIAEAESAVKGAAARESLTGDQGGGQLLFEIVASCTALNELAPDCVLCTPVNTGGRRPFPMDITTPVPSPIVLEILKRSGLPFYGEGNGELISTAGAAILGFFAKPVRSLPLGKATAIGYGGEKDGPDGPRILRALTMELQEDDWGDRVDILETNLDDVTGETLGYLFERLMGMGARDVSVAPITMKKGRPGHLVRIVADPRSSSTLAREMMRETGSLGIRVIPGVHRFTAERSIAEVSLEMGEEKALIPVKIARDQQGNLLNLSGEYENCRAFAEKANMPLKEVLRRVQEEAWKKFGNH